MDCAHNGDAAGARDAADDGHDLGGGVGVEAGGELVEEEDGGALDQRNGEGEAALLAARQAVDELVAAARVLARLQPEVGKEAVHAGAPLRGRQLSVEVRRELDGLAAGEEGPKVVFLRDVGAVAFEDGVCKRMAVQPHFSGDLRIAGHQREKI